MDEENEVVPVLGLWCFGNHVIFQSSRTAHDHEVQQYFENKTECRRRVLSRYFDLPFEASSEEAYKCCDVCSNRQE